MLCRGWPSRWRSSHHSAAHPVNAMNPTALLTRAACLLLHAAAAAESVNFDSVTLFDDFVVGSK